MAEIRSRSQQAHVHRTGALAAAGILLLATTGQASESRSGLQAALASPLNNQVDTGDLKSGDQIRPRPVEVLTVGVGDKLSIWVQYRQDLTGDFKVRLDGKIAVPTLGAIVAEGRSISEIEQDLVQALEHSGQIAPLVSVDVSEWRPIFVVGAVDKPGLFAFRPGMTALQALALAGGLYRPPAGTAAIEASRESWQLRQTRGKLKQALARLARLKAEQGNSTTIELPEALAKISEPGEAELLIRNEQRAMQQRQRAFENQISSSTRGAELAEVEIKALEGELEHVHEQIRLTENDINQIGSLVKSGLTTQVRLNELRRAAANLEGEKRRIQGSIARTQQTMNVGTRERRQIEIDRAIKIEEELQATQEEIRALEIAVLAAEDAVHYLTGGALRGDAGGREPTILYSVTRNENGVLVSRQITEGTELRPGDTVRISRAAPSRQLVD